MWPWRFAQAVADGIAKLKVAICTYAYPETGTDMETAQSAPSAASTASCPGCRRHAVSTHPLHSREPGVCKYSHVEPIHYKCPACQNPKSVPITHPDHTFVPGECSAGIQLTRQAEERTGHDPRPPRQPASAAATEDLQAQLPSGEDLGAAEEQAARLQQADVDRAADEEADADQMGIGPPQGMGAPPGTGAPQLEEPGIGAPEAEESERRTRGERRKWAEKASGTPKASDWTRFDVKATLQVLRTGNKGAVERALRKLHLRWWHATATAMHTTLSMAGINKQVLDTIPDIVRTCRECIAWAKPGEQTQASLSVSTKFNDEVEADILFVSRYMIWHMIDRAIRFHAGPQRRLKSS